MDIGQIAQAYFTGSSGFPDGNAMITENSSDFARIASAALSDPNASSWEKADASQWLGANPSYNANGTNSANGSSGGLPSLASLLSDSYTGGAMHATGETPPDAPSGNHGFWDGLWQPIEKWAVSGVAVVLGIVLLIGAIYTYHNN